MLKADGSLGPITLQSYAGPAFRHQHQRALSSAARHKQPRCMPVAGAATPFPNGLIILNSICRARVDTEVGDHLAVLERPGALALQAISVRVIR